MFAFSVSHAASFGNNSDSEMEKSVEAKAETKSASEAETKTKIKNLNECKDLLPQMERELSETESQFKNAGQSQQMAVEVYLGSFNQMTEKLFQVVSDKQRETAKLSESRNQLRNSLSQFNQQKTTETSKAIQDSYLDLTVRLYSSLMDSQKILESLKLQLSGVEGSRGSMEELRHQLESTDQKRLALEEKLINLKIRCQPLLKY